MSGRRVVAMSTDMGLLARSVLLHGMLGAGSFFAVLAFTLRAAEGTLAWPRSAYAIAAVWLVGGGVYGLLRWVLERRSRRG